MSCVRKLRKRTKSQELVYQEQCKVVAQENGKRIGGCCICVGTGARALNSPPWTKLHESCLVPESSLKFPPKLHL